jgi:hypothetical protein
MGKRQFAGAPVHDSDLQAQEGVQGSSDKKTSSGVQGSGRAIFTLVHMVFNLIDDELTVLDAQKCAGKKVDMVGRAIRLGTGLVNKTTKQHALGNYPFFVRGNLPWLAQQQAVFLPE